MNLFQIQTKFRDEVRPRFGLMRGREFVMKDAYSFHATEEDAEREYRKMYDTYKRIFERCGLKFRAVEADSGSIGGSFSHEFVVLAESGEDAVASCDSCDYAANIEKAISKSKRNLPDKKEAPLPLEKVATPDKRSIEEVAAFMGVKEEHLVKTLIYLADGKPLVALVRGDHELNEIKLKNICGCNELELAGPETVKKATGAPTGFAGPVGLKDVDVYADHTVEVMANFITGGNEKDLHLKNTNLDRDFNVTAFHDLRTVSCGDECPRCEGKLEIHRGIEVGHIFKLGTKYSEAMGATFLDTEGKEKPMFMGCYGIGVGRTAAAAIEQNFDEGGIIWPMALAPYQVIVTAVNTKDDEVMRTAESIYESLKKEGIEVILDDRNERPGVKFKDADLIGIPVRVTVGGRGIKEGKLEVKRREEKEAANIEIDKVVEEVIKIVSSTL
jgi:prolyl-tRNA synthetase